MNYLHVTAAAAATVTATVVLHVVDTLHYILLAMSLLHQQVAAAVNTTQHPCYLVAQTC